MKKQINPSKVFAALEDTSVLARFVIRKSLALLKDLSFPLFSRTGNVSCSFDQSLICEDLGHFLKQEVYQTVHCLLSERLTASRKTLVPARNLRLLVLFFFYVSDTPCPDLSNEVGREFLEVTFGGKTFLLRAVAAQISYGYLEERFDSALVVKSASVISG